MKLRQNSIIQLCACQSVRKPLRFKDKSCQSLVCPSDFFDTLQSCESISWNDCGQSTSDGAKPTQRKNSKKKEDSASKVVPERSGYQPVFPVSSNRQILAKELLLGSMGMKPAVLLIQFSLEGLDR